MIQWNKQRAWIRRWGLTLCALTVAVGASAQTIRVTPQWLPQAQFAGFYVADSLGFYKQEGLDVQFIHPSATSAAVEKLEEGKTDVITMPFIEALKLCDKGMPLVNILQTNQHTGLMVVSRTPIENEQSLKGKRVGHWKSGFSDAGFIMDKQNNLGIEWIPFHSNIALFISGAIDATLAMEYNEYFQIATSGTPIDSSQLYFFRENGYDIYNEGIYVTPQYYKRHKADLEKFARATRKAWEWIRENPEHRQQAVACVMDVQRRHNVHSNPVHQRYMLHIVLRLQEIEPGKAPYTMTLDRFEHTVNLLMDEGYIKEPVMYNDFVKHFDYGN